MKNALILFFLTSPILYSKDFSYDLKVEGDTYELKITMNFLNKNLSLVRENLNNLELQNFFNENIVATKREKNSIYLYLSTYLIKSTLKSDCSESHDNKRWGRQCKLNTLEFDGGKSMKWKKDEVICNQDRNSTKCIFLIEGQAKDISFLGFPIISANKIIVEGKYNALKNFAQIFHYIFKESFHLLGSKIWFEKSKCLKEIENLRNYFSENTSGQLNGTCTAL